MRSYILLFTTMFLSKLFGFIRELSLSFTYGASSTSDIFIFALSIPTLFFGILANGIILTFVPLYSSIKFESPERANDYTNSIMSILILTSTIISVLTIVFSTHITKILGPGFQGNEFNHAVNFLRMIAPTLIGLVIVGVLNGLHQFEDNFTIDPITGVFYNVIITIGILASAVFTNQRLMPISIIIAVILQVLISYIMAKKYNYRFEFCFKITSQELKMIITLAGPILVGSSLSHMNKIADQTISSALMTGAISIINYAQLISTSIYQLFGTTITTVMYPKLSRSVASENIPQFRKQIMKVITIVATITIPASLGLSVLSQDIASIFYGRGALDPSSLTRIGVLLSIYALDISINSFRDVLVRGFYSLKNTKIPLCTSLVGVTTNILLSIILSRKYGLSGIAIATVISTLVSTFLLFLMFAKKVRLSLIDIFPVVIKSLLSAVIMVICIKYIKSNVNVSSEILNIVIMIFIGILVYIICILLMNINKIKDWTGKN